MDSRRSFSPANNSNHCCMVGMGVLQAILRDIYSRALERTAGITNSALGQAERETTLVRPGERQNYDQLGIDKRKSGVG